MMVDIDNDTSGDEFLLLKKRVLKDLIQPLLRPIAAAREQQTDNPQSSRQFYARV